jgi:hypothetical protein
VTPAQSLRLRGYNASLAQRGVSFRTGSGKDFKALLEYAAQGQDGFELGPAQRQDGTIHVLRSTFAALELDEQSRVIQKGEAEDYSDGTTWYLTRIEDNPINIAVLLYCTLDADPE